MYLVIFGQYKKYQLHDIPTHQNFYGWAHDNHVDVIRFYNGRFERMAIVTEERSDSKFVRWTCEWREYPVENL